MTLNDNTHIVLVPPAARDAGLEEKVAAIIEIDPLHVRRLFSAKMPILAAKYDNHQKAEMTLNQLEQLGISAFLCSDSELRKPFHLFEADSLEFGKEEILFRHKNGQESKVASQNAFLIIKCQLEVNREIEVINTKKKLNIPMTLMTGGIPIRKTVQEKSYQTSSQTICFLRLYEKQPSELCIEIKPNDFNFACLGKDMTYTSIANFNIITGKMKGLFAGAIFDETLRDPLRMSLPFASLGENLNITCKLIYKYHQIFNR